MPQYSQHLGIFNMSLKIYKFDPSPSCRSVMMVTKILNVRYETQEVNTANGDQLKPEFLEKNPLHSIPLLEDGDFILTDSHAIITYLVSKYGADKRGILYPSDLGIRATIDQRMFFDATVLFPACRQVARGIRLAKLTEPDKNQIDAVNEGYAVLEKYLQKTTFVACDHVTLADVSLVATVSTLAVLVPVDDKYEKVKAWLNNLQEEEWYQKANLPGLKVFTNFINMQIEKNKQEA